MEPKNRPTSPHTNQQSPTIVPVRKRRPSRRKLLKVLLILLVIMLLVLLAKKIASRSDDFTKAIDKNKYQAVSLTNGQVYFGKLERITKRGYTLKNVYYLQVQPSADQSAAQQPAQNKNFTLSKLGEEVHAPEDTLYIEASQVMLWENLKDDGQVVKAIKDRKP